MKIICPHCQGKAKITHRKQQSEKLAELYCVCLNPACASTFVMRLSHSHDITPPASTLTNSLYEQLANLPPKAKADLLNFFRPAAGN